MPRFTEDEMKQAVFRVTEEGSSVNRVAKENGLCKKTLKSYVDKYLCNFGDQNTEIRFRPNYEINQVFTNKHEKVFEEYLISKDRAQLKITRDFVRKEAYHFATKCNVHVPKTWNVRKQAGLDWMYGYLNRHPKIRSIIVRNRKQTNKWCQNTDDVGFISVDNIRIEDDGDSSTDSFEMAHVVKENTVSTDHEYSYSSVKLEPLDDYGDPAADDNNLSEIGANTYLNEFIENLTSAYNLIAKDGFVNAEQVYSLGEIILVVDDSSDKHQEQLSVTACCFVNAAGNFLPPFFVFPKKKFRRSILVGLPDGTHATTRPNGRLDDESFLHVLKHFQDLVKATPTNKVSLIMDADEYHTTLSSIDFCNKHGIELVTLPPPYSSNLQPAERCIFPIIRFLFNQSLDRFRSTKSSHLTTYHMALLFCRIQVVAFSNDNICKGFSESGIFPLNEQIINESEALSWNVTQYDPPVTLPEISLEFLNICDEDDAFLDETEVEEPTIVELESTERIPVFNTGIPYAPFNKTPMEEFFDSIVLGYRDLEEHGGLKPEKIYNLDEIEISIGIPDAGYPTYISICCCVNAIGRTLPPFLVYPQNEYSPTMFADGIPGMKGTASVDGRINNAIFFQVMEHFQQCVGATLSNRVMLILGCKDYNISLKLIDFCEHNGIILMTVPPYVSKPFQPLEMSAFRTLTSDFQREYMEYIRAEHKTSISTSDIVSFLSKIFARSFVAENIISAFEKVGLWPLNSHLFARNIPRPVCKERRKLKDEVVRLPLDEDVDIDMYEDVDDDDSNAGSFSDSDDSSLISDQNIVHFYNDVRNFSNALINESADERIFVLGELRLNTLRVASKVMFYVNAIGSLLSPYLIYSTDEDDVLMENSMGITAYRCEESIVSADSFMKSINHFREHSCASKQRRTLLLLEDTANLSLTKKIRKFGEKYGIVFGTFPSNHSEYFHPLNKFLKTLKKRFEKSQLNSINDVVGFLAQAIIELFVVEEIVLRFKECEICSTRTRELISLNESSDDERNAIGQETKRNNTARDESTGPNGCLIDYEAYIIEDVIEMAVNEDELMAENDDLER